MTRSTLKHDSLGTIRLIEGVEGIWIERDTRTARPFVRWLARRLAAREATVLATLTAVPDVPRLLAFDGEVVRRSYVPGVPLHEAPPRRATFFRSALRVLRAIHRAGVTHNDLAKEANWLVKPDGLAGVVDFQIATPTRRRNCGFRRRAYEDLRHLLKHKRTYQPERLTSRQRRILARPLFATRLWRAVWKPIYRSITCGLLGWPKSRGPEERPH